MSNRQKDDDPNGYMRYSLGLTFVIICVIGVAGANLLNNVAERNAEQIAALFSPKAGAAKIAKAPQFDNVDRTATGTVRNFLERPIVLDPCTGRVK